MNDLSNPPRRIPDFASREEEAAWWDSQSFTDYLDELEPVEVTFAAPQRDGDRPSATMEIADSQRDPS